MDLEERPSAAAMPHPRVTILVPMFNEVDGLPLFFRQLDDAIARLGARSSIPADAVEVVIVDDGSTDGTGDALLARAPSRPLRILRHQQRRGIGAALWTGIDAARADTVVTADADCTYPLTEIPELLELLGEDTDIVTASPYHPRGGVVGVSRFRLFLSRTLSVLYSAVLGSQLHTYTAVFRAYRRAALEGVPRSDGFLAVTQMLVYPILAGRRVRDYPTVLQRRRFGASKMRVAPVIGAHLRLLGDLLRRRTRRIASPT